MLTSSDTAYISSNLTTEKLKEAAQIVAKGAFTSGGNVFCSIKRIFVDEAIQDKFM